MSESNGRILVSGTTGKILCHPTSGAPLYGIQEGAPISNCDPDLLRSYTVGLSKWGVTEVVDYVGSAPSPGLPFGTGGVMNWTTSYGSGEYITLSFYTPPFSGAQPRWVIFASVWNEPSGTRLYTNWYKSSGLYDECPGPVGAYTSSNPSFYGAATVS